MQITFTEPNQWGKFDVVIKGFGEIKGCKYVESHGFISLPQRKQLDKDGNAVKNAKTGKDKYISDIYLEKGMEAKILEAYKMSKAEVAEQEIPF